jgi:amino acid adenylation domain-containing protein
MIHLSAFLVFLHRHGGGDDPVVAIPVANRNHAAAGEIIGTLVNTLPFRLILDPNESFSDLLDRVRRATFDMQAAQDAPFEKIIEAVRPDRSTNHSPIAQVMFDHQEIPIAETWAGNLECRPYIAHRGAVQFDLSLLVTVLTDRQQLGIEYRTDLFLPATAASFLDRYLHTLSLACEAPERPLESFTCLTQADLEWQRKVSQGPARSDFQNQTTRNLISNRARMHPDLPAVTAGDHQTDYKTLESRSDQLASALHAQGVRVGDRVAILLGRDADLVVSLLAIWKTGAAYVPLDSANPPERLKLILDDQAPIHVLASENTVKGLPLQTSFILLEDCWKAGQSQFIPHHPTPADTAYIIYTSGSTGKPKGVVVSHGALANFLLSMAESPGFHKLDQLLAVTTVSFDISTLELFLPLICGGNVMLATTAVARDGNALRDLIDRSHPTVMQATPATWRMLIDAGWQGSPTMKILCGGEALDLPLATQLTKLGGEVWNLYGPTETTVWSTLWRVPADPKSIRVGSPIANTGIHILSADGAPVPPGVTGELWIYGSGLADGYWKRPELTDSCFVTPTFGARRYRTGDLARWDEDGNLECLGRSDGQVKIRGFRVETGEIESVLASHPQVSQAKVALRETDRSNRKLVAWITVTSGEPQFDIRKIREFMASRLPSYMIPADIGVIDSFPLGSSGKVDVSHLANPDSPPQIPRSMTESEEKLAKIWQDLLETPALHPEDNWFEIGGHSLLVLKLFSRIHTDFKRSLPISAILEHSTLEALAAVIDETPPSSS